MGCPPDIFHFAEIKKSPSCLKIFVFKDKRRDPGDFFLTTIKKSDGIGYENQALRMKFFGVKGFFFMIFTRLVQTKKWNKNFILLTSKLSGSDYLESE